MKDAGMYWQPESPCVRNPTGDELGRLKLGVSCTLVGPRTGELWGKPTTGPAAGGVLVYETHQSVPSPGSTSAHALEHAKFGYRDVRHASHCELKLARPYAPFAATGDV